MQISTQLLEQLLYEDESPTLDFKRDQYPFEGAGNDEKSELLKDILSFVNGWRRFDAYILIGVEEVKGGRSSVVGVTTHLDDAKLQQFVNSKTQRPAHFTYHQAKLENKDIGVLYIPPQERPLYLKKAFGKLERQTVYIRRSSSTDIASPDEIAKMGQAITFENDSLPLLELQFFDSEKLLPLGNSFEAKTENLNFPDGSDIPDYGNITIPAGPGVSHIIPSFEKNRQFYRDMAAYFKQKRETSQIDFYIFNAGSVVAQDVKINLEIDDPEHRLIFRDAGDMMDEPSSSRLASLVSAPSFGIDIYVCLTSRGYVVRGELGKVQAKAFAHTCSGLFVGSLIHQKIGVTAHVFADNLPSPRSCTLIFDMKPKFTTLCVNRLLDMIDKNFSNNSLNGLEK